MRVSGGEVFRAASENDVPQLSKLFAEVFGTTRSESVWLWKYFNNPRGFASFVCEGEGRLVAHCGGTPVRFNDGDREVVALQSVDFMSSVSYPGGAGRGGVFVRTANEFFRSYCGPLSVPLVYGFPGERHRLLGERLLGYEPLERVGELILQPEDGERNELEELTGEGLILFEQSPQQRGVIRDRTYLRWRYLQRPDRHYVSVQVRAWLGRRPTVGAILEAGGDVVNMMELGGDLSESSLQKLVGRLSKLGRPVRFWTSLSHPVAARLLHAGFRPVERDHWIDYRYFGESDPPMPGDFYYTLGDYDVD